MTRSDLKKLIKEVIAELTIGDEFSSLPVSRQRKYQLRKKQQRKCIICGAPTSQESNLFCPKHHESTKLRSREHAKQLYAKQKAQKIGYEIEEQEKNISQD